MRSQFVSGRIPDHRTVFPADHQSIQCIVADLLTADHQCAACQTHIPGYFAIDRAVAGQNGNAHGIQNHVRKLLPRPPRNQGQSKQYHQLKQLCNKKREAPVGRSIGTASGGFSRCFLFAQRFESPHITKMAFCISISSGARFCPLKRLKPLPQQGFQGLHLFQQP